MNLHPKQASRSSLRKTFLALATLGVFTAGAVDAFARDLCLDFAGGGSLVLKGMKVPGRNRCVPFGGFENRYGGAAATGMVCNSASGTELTVHWSSHDWRVNTSYAESGTCRTGVPLPTYPGSGGCSGTYLVAPGGEPTHFYQLGSVRYCDVDVPG